MYIHSSYEALRMCSEYNHLYVDLLHFTKITARKANLTCDTRVLFSLRKMMSLGETVAPALAA